MYSDELLDHFNNPRNSGELADADVRVRVENPVCGDVLELALRITERSIVTARFKAQGCVPAMACGSVLAELITRKSIDQAQTIGREDLLRELNGVPPASVHAVELALDALRQALGHYRVPTGQ